MCKLSLLVVQMRDVSPALTTPPDSRSRCDLVVVLVDHEIDDTGPDDDGMPVEISQVVPCRAESEREQFFNHGLTVCITFVIDCEDIESRHGRLLLIRMLAATAGLRVAQGSRLAANLRNRPW